MVILLENRKIQKNRFKKKCKKIKLKFGEAGLITKNEGRVELVHISIIKKFLKIFLKKKLNETDTQREKIWYFSRVNFLIQKKSKNSRMGKGKGSFDRKTIRLKKNFIFFEFLGVPKIKIEKLAKFLNKILSVKLYIRNDTKINYPTLSKRNKYNYYFNKYLI